MEIGGAQCFESAVGLDRGGISIGWRRNYHLLESILLARGLINSMFEYP